MSAMVASSLTRTQVSRNEPVLKFASARPVSSASTPTGSSTHVAIDAIAGYVPRPSPIVAVTPNSSTVASAPMGRPGHHGMNGTQGRARHLETSAGISARGRTVSRGPIAAAMTAIPASTKPGPVERGEDIRAGRCAEHRDQPGDTEHDADLTGRVGHRAAGGDSFRRQPRGRRREDRRQRQPDPDTGE
jgi:hypothetical protein